MDKQDKNATADQNNDGENLTGKDVVAVRNGPTGVLIGGRKLNIVQQVNVPTLKHETGETVVIRPMQRINLDESSREIEVEVDGIKRNVTQVNEINVLRVIEFNSGQLFNLVLNAITASELRSAYPDHQYVGKLFAIKKLGIVAGKRYKDVQIIEVSDEDEVE